ncbi:MAG: TonB-dependent receptor, partial [Bacteroidales bacterium]|nr:TonB-dependent receptor [Bacteroidales bacterium]
MMKQTKRLWITLLISMGVLCASAQQADYIVSGRACDRNVRTAIPFVRVSLVDADDSSAAYSCLSDGTGYFVFSHVKPGNYLLKISSLNYKTLLVPLEVMRHRMLDTLWMDTDPYSLKAVTVKEKRPIYTVDGEKNIYNVKEDPSVQAGTMADALQQAPGLEVDVEGNVSLRGMSDVEIRINDEPSHLTAITLKQYLKSMPASMVKRIEVIPNPSARYASSGGGIVNIVTTSPVNSSEFLSFGTGVASLPYVLPWITYVYSK